MKFPDFSDFSKKITGEKVKEIYAEVNSTAPRIAAMFRCSDTGCQNRKNGNCKFGVKYVF